MSGFSYIVSIQTPVILIGALALISRLMVEDSIVPAMKKNPLAVAFGMALKKMRGRNLSTTVAGILGVSESFVRLLETGSTNIHAGKTLRLMQAFPRIKLLPLSRLLVAITVTDLDKRLSQYRQAIQDLRVADEDSYDRSFHFLIKRVSAVLTEHEQTGHYLEEIIFRFELDDYVLTYLTTTPSPSISSTTVTSSMVAPDPDDVKFDTLLFDTPSIYIDTVSFSLTNLKYINPNFFAQNSSEWENANTPSFTKLIAVVKDINRLVNPKNTERFTYRYLFNDHFKELQYIILNEDKKKPAEDWENEFRTALVDRWGTSKTNSKPEQRLVKDALDKITIKKARFTDDGIQDFLKMKNLKGDIASSEMTWVFATIRGNKIGFSLQEKDHDPERIYGRTLTYREAMNKYHQFCSLWEKIK